MTGELPSPSTIGLRILHLTREEDHSIDELAATIAADVALSGRIVRLANTTRWDGLEPATTVREAARRLGADAVRAVALGFTLVADNRSGACEAFDHDLYWARSLAVAVCAQHIASATGDAEPVEAFTCGLLGQVGRLALASVHPGRYSDLLDESPEAAGEELAELEQDVFGIDHMEVAAALFEDWGLPSEQAAASALAEGITLAGCEVTPWIQRLGRLLTCAHAIAELVLNGRLAQGHSEGEDVALPELEQLGAQLGLPTRELTRLCLGIQEEWNSWSELFDVPSRVSAPAPVLASEDVQQSEAEVPVREEQLQLLSGASDDESLPTVLVVEDDEQMMRLTRFHLERAGYSVLSAASSEEGLELALGRTPQLVVADWVMPGMSGIALCEALRRTEVGRKMYILIVTAREDDDEAVKAFGSGADDYIVKPFNPRILLARIRAGERMIVMREQVEAAERARLRQVAELGILTRKLRAAALTDSLTDLPNRRYAMERLKQEWDSSQRTKRPLSVLMIDIDHFKQVNDVYGHEVGDTVLSKVGRLMRDQMRGGDVLSRLGGEEFLSINVSAELEEAVVAAERIRRGVAELIIHTPAGPISVTVSIGVAERTPQMQGLDDLLRAADEALYIAKTLGRDRIQRHGEDLGRRSA